MNNKTSFLGKTILNSLTFFISAMSIIGCSPIAPNNDGFFENSFDTIYFAESSDCFLDNSSQDSASSLEETFGNSEWDSNLKCKLDLLNFYRTNTSDFIQYCFFTDPHFFWPTGDYSFGNHSLLDEWINFLKNAYYDSFSSFMVCGGDLLTNNDSISQAVYKLSFFDQLMKTSFDNYYFVVGNHDFNYQGNTYVSSGDRTRCTLSQEIINDIFFDGHSSYYSFSYASTSYYVFDSGIDWEDKVITQYKKEQLKWFSDCLLRDSKPHKTLLLHIPLMLFDEALTAFTSSIGDIISAYNDRNSVTIDGIIFDYSNSFGHIDYIQSGHFHTDINDYTCGGVPIIITRSFSSMEVATRPTFDFVFTDYSNSIVRCVRVGDGEDRLFYF